MKGLSEMRARLSRELVALTTVLEGTQGELERETVVREAFERSRKEWKTAAGDAFDDVEGLRAKLGAYTSLVPARSTSSVVKLIG